MSKTEHTLKPAWEAACDFNDSCRSWLDEGELRRLSRLLEIYRHYGRRSRDAEVATLTAVRDELVEALRDCARVIEHDLESPRVAMPELRQARSALAKAKGGGA